MAILQSPDVVYKQGFTILKKTKEINPKSLGVAYNWVRLINRILL